MRVPDGYKGDGSEMMLNPWMAAQDVEPIVGTLRQLWDTLRSRAGSPETIDLFERVEANPHVKALINGMSMDGPESFLKQVKYYLSQEGTDNAAKRSIDQLGKVLFPPEAFK